MASDPHPGTVQVLFEHGRTRIVLSGDVDAHLEADLMEALAAAQEAEAPVDVDTRNITFMDSTGVGFLAGLVRRVGREVTVLDPPPPVRFLVGLTKVNTLVRVVDTTDGHTADPQTTAPANHEPGEHDGAHDNNHNGPPDDGPPDAA